LGEGTLRRFTTGLGAAIAALFLLSTLVLATGAGGATSRVAASKPVGEAPSEEPSPTTTTTLAEVTTTTTVATTVVPVTAAPSTTAVTRSAVTTPPTAAVTPSLPLTLSASSGPSEGTLTVTGTGCKGPVATVVLRAQSEGGPSGHGGATPNPDGTWSGWLRLGGGATPSTVTITGWCTNGVDATYAKVFDYLPATYQALYTPVRTTTTIPHP
jgi:hypothetical protein